MLSEQQINLIDDALESYFGVHYNRDSDTQETSDLLNLIIDTRIQLAQMLKCSECENPRMGFHSDLCNEHYAQLVRGELKIRV